eukprot:m.88949 g.88949  ORF g.88949 m.88949 type:complete len:69 (-) comp14959_c1_seq1:166-372(-)
MPNTQRMRSASAKHAKNVNRRGLVPKSTVKAEEKYPVGPLMLGFFIFVVCGSALFSILQSVRTGSPQD